MPQLMILYIMSLQRDAVEACHQSRTTHTLQIQARQQRNNNMSEPTAMNAESFSRGSVCENNWGLALCHEMGFLLRCKNIHIFQSII